MPQDITVDSLDKVYISDVGDAHPEISYTEKTLRPNEMANRFKVSNPFPAFSPYNKYERIFDDHFLPSGTTAYDELFSILYQYPNIAIKLIEPL